MVILLSGNTEDENDIQELVLNPFVRLSRDLKNASTTLDEAEARFLVDYY